VIRVFLEHSGYALNFPGSADFLLLTKDRRLQTIAKELQVGYFDPKFAPGLQ
jgi:hypothetical protein